MTNHEQRSLELLAEIGDLQTELRETYRSQRLGNPGNHSTKINDLHQRIGVLLKVADIHATLSLGQAIQDASADRLANGVTV